MIQLPSTNCSVSGQEKMNVKKTASQTSWFSLSLTPCSHVRTSFYWSPSSIPSESLASRLHWKKRRRRRRSLPLSLLAFVAGRSQSFAESGFHFCFWPVDTPRVSDKQKRQWIFFSGCPFFKKKNKGPPVKRKGISRSMQCIVCLRNKYL